MALPNEVRHDAILGLVQGRVTLQGGCPLLGGLASSEGGSLMSREKLKFVMPAALIAAVGVSIVIVNRAGHEVRSWRSRVPMGERSFEDDWRAWVT
ncbi:MAG: hypothetical protein M3Q30_20085 [Actinomycetota bacterium]|nr:hypothetical protein [Actinomycetota bacterium]